MSTRRYDSFKNLRKNKYDWKVHARVLNLWRGFTKTGEPFKGFNLLLLDDKRARMHAWVPWDIAPHLEQLFEVGKIYLFQNFTVKDYEAKDKFRPFRKSHQIVFGSDTVITEIEEHTVSIEQTWFDFYDYADLEPLSKQMLYLTDVVGVIEEHDPIGKFRNKNGQIQSQIKFNITDGRSSTKVTFWDEFAEIFAESEAGELEHPIIIIIGCARVTKWGDDTILTNVHATTYYLNYQHHCVNDFRKMLSKPEFDKKKLLKSKRRSYVFYKVEEIKNFGAQHSEREVLCHVILKDLKPMTTWCKPICTSCYQDAELVAGSWTCNGCTRFLPYADKWFEVYVLVTDDTGEIQVLLENREVRTLVGKTAFELIQEGNNEIILPNLLLALLNKEVTLKIMISELNVQKRSHLYLATDIMEGFNPNINDQPEESHPHPIESMGPEASGSTYNLGSDS